MKVYKLKHKPTGLFYSPNTGSGNLTLNGKLYVKLPKIEKNIFSVRVILNYISAKKKLSPKNKALVNYFNIRPVMKPWGLEYSFDKRFIVPEEDWEIVEIN